MENEVKNMEPIKVIVVDDEPRCVLGLVEQLGKLPDFEVVATSNSPKTAIELIIKLNPDVVFLDVEMPKMTGFDVLQELRGKVSEDMMVVFYTAFDKYMIDALRASAFDFLLKPYEEGEFKKVLARIRERMEQLRSNPLAMIDTGLSDRMLALDNLMSRKVAIQTVSGLVMLNPQEVFSFTFLDDARIWVLKLADGTEYPPEEADHLQADHDHRRIVSASASGCYHQSGLPDGYRKSYPALPLLATSGQGRNLGVSTLFQECQGQVGYSLISKEVWHENIFSCHTSFCTFAPSLVEINYNASSSGL